MQQMQRDWRQLGDDHDDDDEDDDYADGDYDAGTAEDDCEHAGAGEDGNAYSKLLQCPMPAIVVDGSSVALVSTLHLHRSCLKRASTIPLTS